jgi:hypothetical protein
MWKLACAVFSSSCTGLASSFMADEAWTSMLIQQATFFWMMHGARRLGQGGWRSSYGRDGAVWLIKDGLAMLIWPILYRWIARRSETE